MKNDNAKNPAHKPAHCPRCHAIVMVWKRPGIKASLLRALAVADHIKTLHAPWRFGR